MCVYVHVLSKYLHSIVFLATKADKTSGSTDLEVHPIKKARYGKSLVHMWVNRCIQYVILCTCMYFCVSILVCVQ